MSSTGTFVSPTTQPKRVVVVSPHLDDGVLSLGAAISAWARRGVRVELLTVLACSPDSAAPAGGWDARSRFGTEGEAARTRRDEDRNACAVLGAAPVWLPFGSIDYERHGGGSDVSDAVGAALDRANDVLLPGYPLSHPDHAWLTRLLVERSIPCDRLGLYAEQPYAFRARARMSQPVAPGWLEDALGSPIVFERLGAAPRDRLAKLRAIRRYRSQLGPLALDRRGGIPLLHLLLSEARLGGEAVAWISRSDRVVDIY